MSLYEFTFIAQQSLSHQEAEEMASGLGVLLRSIKADVILQKVKGLLKCSKLTKQELETQSRAIQGNLVDYSNSVEGFVKILWSELEEDFSNLKEVKSKIDTELKGSLKNLGITQNFIKSSKDDKQIAKGAFIFNIVSALKENIAEYVIKLLQDFEINDSTKELETLLEDIGALGLIKYECWGLLNFAYPIKKMKNGYYSIMCISSTSSIMGEFERRVKLDESIIRYFSVQVSEFFKGKSYMMNKQIEEQSV